MDSRGLTDWMISFQSISCDAKVCYVPTFCLQLIQEKKIQSPLQCATTKVFKNVVRDGRAELSVPVHSHIFSVIRNFPLSQQLFFSGPTKIESMKKGDVFEVSLTLFSA